MTTYAYFVGGSQDGETLRIGSPEARTIVLGRTDGTAEAYVNTETTRLLDGVPHIVFELRRR